MPSLGVLLLGYFNAFPIIPQVFTQTLIITFFGTYVFPGVLMVILYLLGGIADLEIKIRHERNWPLIISAFTYYAVYRILSTWPLAPQFIGFFAGMSISVFLALILNRWIKISIHMIGAGGLVGLTLALNTLFGVSSQWPLIGSILLAGLIGSSRLYLGAHKAFEVYLGFSVGLCCILMAMILS